ncbi:aspartate aminotransferase family protein [Cytophaga aurantiaca]|uniref:aspartate aminotransferase family protein n=1 Tax=Cytophaga aurantiaca TaxID=29530 RepID=UPI00037F01EC|nr:aspartate aminotransferase family protein [Cytophaga aurantiaca]
MLTNRQLFLNHNAQTSDTPLLIEINQASGVYMYGADNTKYLDLISGIGVSNVGHCHPKVVQAVQDQAAKYMHLMVYGEFIQTPQVELAVKLTSTLPKQLDAVYLVNSGSEATEGALKLAKRYTNRRKIISCVNAYHGSSHGALSVMGNEFFKQSFRPLLPGIKHIHFNRIEDLVQITEQTAAVIIETIQGEAGVRVADTDYMKALRKRCTYTGTLLILDEIQCGFGRTGSFWAFEKYGIEPDILLTAKGMGGGMPIGAFISSKKIMDTLSHNPVLGHITTFGGHPVSCAAALACIDIIKEDALIESVEHKANLFLKHLKHPGIKEIRNAGLMMAVEFESYPVLKKIIDQAIKNGVLTDWFLFCDNSMRIAPPLIITDEQIVEACSIISSCK